ncbi:hypothetical protein R1521_35590 [Rhizobium brockwellii]|uniref:Uncharacterized protein n=1 Tax=Rhizobium brockwellii TaxID=3019932 RepID=A0ABU3YYK9_9HYPH|nr:MULTISPECIES: hypothetical protein [Rhizobium]MDV4183771.1 hypothetical protein [Rhizobium brockwellii]MDV4190763.1 hypothetical protein [Rhizobium brockwellii]NZD54740.1 hypothetical protein [Rhizobium leguminosarum]
MIPMGTSLSRWTMSYFAAALFFLLFAEGLLTAGGWSPSLDLAEPRSLIIVHSTTIGWLALLMIGALLQFGPVLTGLELPKGSLGLVVLCGMVVGLVLLLSGFGLTGAGSALAGPVMCAAGATLAVSFLSIAAALFSLLWRGRHAHESQLPLRNGEQTRQGFWSAGSLQHFVSIFSAVRNSIDARQWPRGKP